MAAAISDHLRRPFLSELSAISRDRIHVSINESINAIINAKAKRAALAMKSAAQFRKDSECYPVK
jgi:hypothetical protein